MRNQFLDIWIKVEGYSCLRGWPQKNCYTHTVCIHELCHHVSNSDFYHVLLYSLNGTWIFRTCVIFFCPSCKRKKKRTIWMKMSNFTHNFIIHLEHSTNDELDSIFFSIQIARNFHFIFTLLSGERKWKIIPISVLDLLVMFFIHILQFLFCIFYFYYFC